MKPYQSRHKYQPCLLVTLAVIFSYGGLHAEIKLPGIFGNDMVLQADMKIPVWGSAAPGENVSVQLGAQSAKTQAGADGKWRVELDPLPASYSSLSMVVTGSNHVEYKNVLIGEVWLCSGQSNMYYNMAKDADAAAELPKAGDPNLRFFSVPEQEALHPQDNLRGAWKISDPESAKNFSAVAYYFGKQLRQKLDRPVGLIHSSVGGTVIQVWMSLDALRKDPPFTQDIAPYQKWLDNYEQNKTAYPQQMAEYATALKKWQDEVETPYKATLAQWQVQDGEAKKNHQPEPPAPVVPHGPPKPLSPEGDRTTPTAPFNGMIAPLLPFGFKGMVWYQGESNTGPRGGEYGEMLSRMVTDWRAKAGRDFAFLVVLIEYYHDPSKEPVRSGRAEIREGEFHVLDLPQTAIADALDQGAARTVHPPRKIEVGRRVSLAALSVAYGQKIVASGPLYQAAKVEGNQIRITFRPSESGLVIGPTSGSDATTPLDKLSGFAIAGSDKKWVWADAMIDGNTVVVKGNGVSAPVAIRYAWSDNPPANLYNQAGLPALPFRTDTWDEKAIIQEKATSSSNEPNDQLH